MDNKHDFLDFTQRHKLTELECELVTFFRAFTQPQKREIMQMLFSMAINDERLAKIAKKRKGELE